MLNDLFDILNVDLLVPLFSPIIVVFIQNNSMRSKLQPSPFRALILLSFALFWGWEAGTGIDLISDLIQKEYEHANLLFKMFFQYSWPIIYLLMFGFFLFLKILNFKYFNTAIKRLALEFLLLYSGSLLISVIYRMINFKFDSNISLTVLAFIIVIFYFNWSWTSLNPIVHFRIYLKDNEQQYDYFDLIKQDDVYHCIKPMNAEQSYVNGLTIKVQDIEKIEHIYDIKNN